MNSDLAKKTIDAVDGLYTSKGPDGKDQYKYVPDKFHADQITHDITGKNVTEIHVTDNKGLGHQLKKAFGLSEAVAEKMAKEILHNNHVKNPNAISPQKAIHISEAEFNHLSGGAPKAATHGKETKR